MPDGTTYTNDSKEVERTQVILHEDIRSE
jgi:hypothetical protein